MATPAAAIIGSAIIGAGSNAVIAQKANRAQQRILAAKRKQTETDRASQIRNANSQKEAELTRRRVAKGEKQAIINTQLKQKGIKAIGNNISDAVLREGQ